MSSHRYTSRQDLLWITSRNANVSGGGGRIVRFDHSHLISGFALNASYASRLKNDNSVSFSTERARVLSASAEKFGDVLGVAA